MRSSKLVQLIAPLAVLASVAPAAAQQRGVVVLIPGAGGGTPNDFLVRNQNAYRAAGFETVIAVGSSSAVAAAARAQGRGKVYGVGMSAGATHLAEAIAAGARFDRAVFVSGAYLPPSGSSAVGRGVIAALGDARRLPPTLVVHNRNDACVNTPPGGVQAFTAWARGRATARWIASSDTQSPPCRARSPHGYLGADRAATGAILGFLR